MENPCLSSDCKCTFTNCWHFSFQYASKQVQGMKEGMSQLEKIQSDLAEFFCEEVASFKIDECFKSFAGFNAKLKQVINCVLMTRITFYKHFQTFRLVLHYHFVRFAVILIFRLCVEKLKVMSDYLSEPT